MIHVKTTMKIVCSTIMLSSLLYAGEDKNIVPAKSLVIPITEKSSNTTPFYVGAGFTAARVESYYFGPDTAYSGVLRLGYDYNDYIGVEVRGNYAVITGDQLGHDYSYGLYLKPQYPINETWNVYGLLGYGQTKISFENQVAFNGNTNNYTTQNDFSFGLGLDYQLDNNWSLFVDVVRFINKSTTKPEGNYASKIDGITFGSAFHF